MTNTNSTMIQARRATGRVVRALAGAAGFDVVRRGTAPAPAPAPIAPAVPDDQLLIPRGRHEQFEAGDYLVLPKGRYDVVESNFYSPIPNLDELPADIFSRRSELGGITMDAESAMAGVERDLAPYVAELADMPLDGPRPPGEFFLNNDNYGPVDAELLYAMVRASKPARVVELGSGYTTLLINQAVRRNVADGTVTDHVAYDPYPRDFIFGDTPPEGSRFAPIMATDVPMSAFEELESGDVLFVDTTHTVKLGSDVNHIILDVLPRLAPGVIVHFHDIFLPFEYPENWFTQFRYLWAEQYLLQAFLAYNSAFEVVLPTSLLAAEFPERVGQVVPTFAPGCRPGAFWLRRS
ncbi:class I SAM-dependent methyltransferase [Baekduia sp. Peel2402]|uniref:class I SAM-dependent methyltransferase n=1 Tax=Baekduia sp. Peel2402 TaxID=3458296 RepID=UPI00403E9A44